jgi:hypothetical protein
MLLSGSNALDAPENDMVGRKEARRSLAQTRQAANQKNQNVATWTTTA